MLRSGDLSRDAWSPNHPADALRAHQRIQQSRPREYSKEVAVSHRVDTTDFAVEVSGRVDGVYRYPDRVIIDEIKTTTGSLDQLAGTEDPVHWGQARIYAYIYAIQNDLEDIDLQLTYHHLLSGETRHIQSRFTVAELETFFFDVLGRYVKWIERIDKWQAVRNESIRSLPFPYASYRPGQRRIAVAVFRTVKDEEQVTVQAPTGIGKTMAVTFPTLKAMGEGLTDRFLYLTARTTGKAPAENSLAVLRARGLRAKSVTLTAKDKICFNPGKACNAEECEFARGFYDRIDVAVDELFTRDDFTRDVVEAVARRHRVCPFELSLELALWADVVIADYNYAFDPGVYLKRLLERQEDRRVFLVDEAHNLVDRARDMFSAEVRKEKFLELRRESRRHLEIFRALGRVNTELVKWRKRCEASGDSISVSESPEDLYPPLKRFLRAVEKWLPLSAETPRTLRDKTLDRYFDAYRFLRVAERYDEAYSTCCERIGNDLRLKLFCKDPSSQLAEALKRARSVVFFSATLTPASYFRSIFGCPDSTGELILPSPFPNRHLGVLISDRISTLYRKRQETKEVLARSLSGFVRQKVGNYILYFPSYDYMMTIYELFSAQCSGLKTILQTPEMTESDRDRFLEEFSRANQQTLVGFAVMGGVFGESIDLVGDRLTGAAIVGVGLPGISRERELIRQHFHGRGAGFEYAYLYPGINRVLQAAGRVIRSETDRGVVLLIDERFSQWRYRVLLPSEWQPIRVRDEQHIEQALESFWSC